jgi:hypothetical protein
MEGSLSYCYREFTEAEQLIDWKSVLCGCERLKPNEDETRAGYLMVNVK